MQPDAEHRASAGAPCWRSGRRVDVKLHGLWLASGLTASLLGGTVLAQNEKPQDTRAAMRRVYGALARLLPAALAEKPMSDERQRAQLREATEVLWQDAALIRSRLGVERYEDAGYWVIRMTESCIACHSRLPSIDQPTFAAKLVESVDGGALLPVQRARLEIALRQFDSALETHEKLMADPRTSPLALDYTGTLVDYLVVSLRVRQTPERARKGLQALARRADLPGRLRRDVAAWIAAITELTPDLTASPTLERAARILEQGEALRRHPADRIDLVHCVVGSSMLYRYLQTDSATSDTLAEASYLLAVSDAFLRRSFERSEAQFHLERTIRLVPNTELARVAYAQLESETFLSYSGSSGLHVPDDVLRWLAELRVLAGVAD
jgi:tetratricopeptide (TPR) repeat protein